MFTPLFAGGFSFLPSLGLLRPHTAAESLSKDKDVSYSPLRP